MMMRKSTNKLAALANQVNAWKRQQKPTNTGKNRAFSVEQPAANASKTQKGFFDQGAPIALEVESTPAPIGRQMSVQDATERVEEFSLDWNTQANDNGWGDHSTGQSLENGTYTQNRNGAVTTITKNDQGLYAQKTKLTEAVGSKEPEEDTFKLDFEDDLEAILNGTDADEDTFQLPKAREVNQVTSISRQKSIPDNQPKAHSIFDKMAQGMEYAQTFDLGTVDMSNVFDQFDTAMEVNEISKAKTIQPPQSHEMASVFDAFDAEAVAAANRKAEAMNLVPVEPAKITKRPDWNPTNPNITGWDALMPTYGVEYYLLEKSPVFMREVLEPFNSGQYAWIPLNLTTFASNDVRDPAGEGKIQVNLNGTWTDLYTVTTPLDGMNLAIDRDFRITVSFNTFAQTGQTSTGKRISLVVHELGLHGLQGAAMLERYRVNNLTPEQLRIEYTKSVDLELHHHQVRGELQPKNDQYQAVKDDVARMLTNLPNWNELGEFNLSLISFEDKIPSSLLRTAKHLQTQTPKQLPVGFTYMLAANGEIKSDYNPAHFFNVFGIDFKGVTRQQLDDLMQNGTLQDVTNFTAQRQKTN